MLNFKGNITALITPFKNEKVDVDTFERLVDWQIKEGVHGLVPCGTTGEAITLSSEEYRKVIEITVKVSAGRVPVIAGSGTNSTEKTISNSRVAEDCGADGLLVVSPYYNKPSQDGLYAHFKAVHDSTRLPIIVYDIPPRSIVEISVKTMGKLSALPRIVGVKDATGALHKPLQLRKACGAEFIQLSGDDGSSFAHLAQGGRGCISVISNLAPKLCSEMQNAWIAGNIALGQSINEKLQPLRDALFCEPSPAPSKFGAELLGFGSREVRLPLVAVSETAQREVQTCMKELGLLG